MSTKRGEAVPLLSVQPLLKEPKKEVKPKEVRKRMQTLQGLED